MVFGKFTICIVVTTVLTGSFLVARGCQVAGHAVATEKHFPCMNNAQSEEDGSQENNLHFALETQRMRESDFELH